MTSTSDANKAAAGGRAIDFHEGDEIDEQALQALVRAAVALNTSGSPRTGKRA